MATPEVGVSPAVHSAIVKIINEFDYWLALQVLNNDLKYEDLPYLNDTFRDYFLHMRTTR